MFQKLVPFLAPLVIAAAAVLMAPEPGQAAHPGGYHGHYHHGASFGRYYDGYRPYSGYHAYHGPYYGGYHGFYRPHYGGYHGYYGPYDGSYHHYSRPYGYRYFR